ncbi:putative quinol monooxygenase [Staphylococcus edaphicus]|uniref:Signal transduction protein TRAP n=1 Tax=Staphylococcus edaphicus TaxID=1955013 RepID=A0A2C6WMP7_9STAP|nr:putative quinol monooxygenase [Staphylococcus edaphicus]PHK49639.1 antibiotic biosynthesis monooxygenase [Staphylococcus edaphicus]UQW81938.1 antibiotic biosynthesis monooxygenase [Staphylococcus edaphicus]
MVTVNAIMKINPEYRDSYLALVEPLVIAANKEEGALYYAHFERTDEPNTFAFIEQYRNEYALEAHNESQHFQKFFAEVKQYLLTEPVIKVLSSN